MLFINLYFAPLRLRVKKILVRLFGLTRTIHEESITS